MATAYPLGPSDSVDEGSARVFEVEDLRLAVCRVEGQLYAIEDVCTHDDGPLGEGCLEGHHMVCPRHGAHFDVRTGAAKRMPAVVGVKTYAVREEDGQIVVEL